MCDCLGLGMASSGMVGARAAAAYDDILEDPKPTILAALNPKP